MSLNMLKLSFAVPQSAVCVRVHCDVMLCEKIPCRKISFWIPSSRYTRFGIYSCFPSRSTWQTRRNTVGFSEKYTSDTLTPSASTGNTASTELSEAPDS